MPYKYDIFVSYKRDPETLLWLSEHFVPLLRLRVNLQLGRDPKIYVHEVTHTVPAGLNWPVELAADLGCSRTLIALWTKNYFNSKWCTEEMSRMLAREKEAKRGLVIPVVVGGDDFPGDLSMIQKIELQHLFNTRMARNSSKAEELSDLLDKHAATFAAAITKAPAWRKAWPQAYAKRFVTAYYQPNPPRQSWRPRFQQR